jgi:Ni,Fe-hydrogenase III component G
MTPEENIQLELYNRFPFLRDQVKIQRARRIWVTVGQDHFLEVFDYVVKEMKVTMLCAITGLDGGANLEFIYHLAQDTGITINLITTAPKEKPVIKTVIDYFPQAEAYERELVDLLGANVQGLPPGSRYPLTDDWPAGQYPLRKDWRGTGVPPVSSPADGGR